MRRHARLFMVAVCLLGLSMALGQGAVAVEPGRELSVPDVLTSPSRPVQLRARLIEHFPDGDRGLAEESVKFFLQGRLLGTVQTDADGWAQLEFSPKMRGNLSLRAKWDTAKKASVVEGHGVLLSWERRRPILLIDIAVLVEGELMAEAPSEEIMQLFGDPGLVLENPSVEAPAELRKLAKFYYNLVYVDQTGKGRIEVIQSWLRKQELPPGMIRILSQANGALPTLLEELKQEGWENVSGGIGRTANFAEVLVKNRLTAIVLPLPNNTDRFPRRAIVLQDWSRVRRHL